ncbi:MAG: hypothetical protein C0446_14820 [Chitinophaga sp.]|nr:hypothetical protein [Chitinophaga sp.]
MVFTNKYSKILMRKFSNFGASKSLEETISFFCPNREDIDEHVVFTGLTRYVIDELIPSSILITNEEIEIYNYLEEMLHKFSNYALDTEENLFSNGMCVCFLENLLNYASAEQIDYNRFMPYLGDKCKDYCKGWDHFTGVRSPGLWSDEEWENLPPFQ